MIVLEVSGKGVEKTSTEDNWSKELNNNLLLLNTERY